MSTPKTVMIVDDEAIVALAIKNLLEKHGYHALMETSGEGCLRHVETGDLPDLVLMDINLGTGRMDGPETTRRIHEHAEIPVVLHSAYTDPATIQGTRDMTKYGYVHKVPGNEEFVLATVEMAFRLQERERMYRDLSAHVNRMREEQNAFIAREIHDDLGQSLAALKMNLTMLERSMKRPVTDPIISDMREILDATVLKVRFLIHELRPPVFDTPDSVEALSWYAREFEKMFSVPCRFTSRIESITLPPEESLAVFRVVQEALTNSARHGDPTRIAIEMRRENHSLVVTVTDDGHGFSVGAHPQHGTFGILGMQERAEQWNGSVRITSTPGEGTTVTAEFPIPRNEESRQP